MGDHSGAQKRKSALTALPPQVKSEDARDAEQLIEKVAKTIYEGWAGQPGYVPWQEGGNSNMQNLARARARAATQGDHHG